jgi:hypothetical protein
MDAPILITPRWDLKFPIHIDMAMGVMQAQNPRLENVISPLLMFLVFLTMQNKMTPLLK